MFFRFSEQFLLFEKLLLRFLNFRYNIDVR